MLRDKIIAAARTGFAVLGAVIVTWAVAQLANLGVIVKVDETWSTVLAGAMFAVFVGVYNFIVAWLTENVWDGFGWLLGVNKPPAYDTVSSEIVGDGEDDGMTYEESGGLPFPTDYDERPLYEGDGSTYDDYGSGNPDRP
jgi:hypothetical protein